jgi:hypothetical protein
MLHMGLILPKKATASQSLHLQELPSCKECHCSYLSSAQISAWFRKLWFPQQEGPSPSIQSYGPGYGPFRIPWQACEVVVVVIVVMEMVVIMVMMEMVVVMVVMVVVVKMGMVVVVVVVMMVVVVVKMGMVVVKTVVVKMGMVVVVMG